MLNNLTVNACSSKTKGKEYYVIHISISSSHSIQEFKQYLLQLRILQEKKGKKADIPAKNEYEQKVQVNEFLLSKIDATTGFIKNRALNLEIRTCSI